MLLDCKLNKNIDTGSNFFPQDLRNIFGRKGLIYQCLIENVKLKALAAKNNQIASKLFRGEGSRMTILGNISGCFEGTE